MECSSKKNTNVPTWCSLTVVDEAPLELVTERENGVATRLFVGVPAEPDTICGTYGKRREIILVGLE